DAGDARDVLVEGGVLHLPLYLGALDLAPLPVRPAHGARLEGHAAARARLHHRDGQRHLAAARPARLDLRRALRAGAVRPERAPGHPVVLRARPRTPHLRVGGARGGLMAIGVKVLKRPRAQTSYVRATLKGMALGRFSTLTRSEEHTSELQSP